MNRITRFPQWKGFEISPRGCLLEQAIDLSDEFGFAYERSCEFYKDFHTHDRMMFVCPRGSSSMEVRTVRPRKVFTVDSTSILIVPKDIEHDDEGTSAIYDTMALFPTHTQILAVAKRHEIQPEKIDHLMKKCLKIKRSSTIDQLLQEYFFQKVLSNRPSDESDSAYLGRRIIEEVLKTVFPEAFHSTKSKEAKSSESTMILALKYIESNLFERLTVEGIAKHSAASVSTLMRKFQLEVGTTPYSYIKNRRLEEALYLLKTNQHTVGSVALLVGYQNFGAFSEAFKQKYGKSPSAFQK